MVFRANVSKGCIYDNVFGVRFNGIQEVVPKRRESALIGAALWDSSRGEAEASTLSGGEQQRLCMLGGSQSSRGFLMDEPIVAGPDSCGLIEELVAS